MNSANIKVEAMIVYYGEDLAQSEKIIISPSITKASLAAKYFMMYAVNAGNIVKHLFWFKTQVADAAPAITDATLHEVDVTASTTIQEIAAELVDVIDGVTGVYEATLNGLEVTVDHTVEGYAPQAEDAKLTGKQTNFGFEMLVQGDTEEDVGCIEGEIEASFEESFLDVTCHSEGVTPVAQLKTGVSSVEITMNLEETTKAQMKKMFVKTNGSFIPDGGTEVFGMGTYKNFDNMFKYAAKLRLHPKRLLPADRRDDITFHKAIPNLSGLTFSGEAVFTIPVTFKVFPAPGVDSRVNYFSIGDGTQSLV